MGSYGSSEKDARSGELQLIASDWHEMRGGKTISSKYCSFKNNVDKSDHNPPFRYF